MTRLEKLLVYAESHRLTVCGVSIFLIAITAWADWRLPDISIGYLYLIPLLLSAAALNGLQILAMAAVCGVLREAFDPLEWAPGAGGRLVTATIGFAMTGFFVAQINQRRRLLAEHLVELEKQIRLRREAEQQLRILIETSPLAIL